MQSQVMSSCLQGVKKQTFDCQAVGVACVEQILQEKMQISSSALPKSGSAYKRNIKMSSIRALHTENTVKLLLQMCGWIPSLHSEPQGKYFSQNMSSLAIYHTISYPFTIHSSPERIDKNMVRNIKGLTEARI